MLMEKSFQNSKRGIFNPACSIVVWLFSTLQKDSDGKKKLNTDE